MPQHHLNFTVRRERDRRAFARQLWLLVCGLVLAGGFIIAARQHFAAVRHGYKNEELRRERARLLEEQQRLLMALDESAAPLRLERAARAIGLQPTRPAQIDAGTKSVEAGMWHPGNPAFVGSAGASLNR